MTGREQFRSILCGKSTHCGFWHDNPHEESLGCECFGAHDDLGRSEVLGDTLVWLTANNYGGWKHLEGKPSFYVTGCREKQSLTRGAYFPIANTSQR